jgi:hypothetical protein
MTVLFRTKKICLRSVKKTISFLKIRFKPFLSFMLYQILHKGFKIFFMLISKQNWR